MYRNEKTNNSALIVGDFNISLLVMHRIVRRSIGNRYYKPTR